MILSLIVGNPWQTALPLLCLLLSAPVAKAATFKVVDKFSVNGSASFGTSGIWRGAASQPASGVGDGAIYFDSSSGKFKISENAGAWSDLSSPSTAGGWTDGGATVRTASLGANVGIGTAIPGARLEIAGDGETVLFPRKSTTGNPIGSNGMIYYNTADAKFRCFQAGAWTDCIGGGGAPGGANSQVQFNNAGIFAGDSGLIWDNANKRLGIGVAAPAQALAVLGNIALSGSLNLSGAASDITSAANEHIALMPAGTGNVGVGTTSPTTGKLVVAGGNLDVSSNRITNVASPTAGSDAATKGYVDAAAGAVGKYVAFGVTTCAAGWTVAYTGTVLVHGAAGGSSGGGGGKPICVGGTVTENVGSGGPNVWFTRVSDGGSAVSARAASPYSCALCVK